MLLGAPSARLCPLPQWRVAAVSAAVVQIKEVRRKWQPWPEPRAERGVKVCSYPGDYQAAIAWSAALAAGWGPPSDDPVLTQPCVQPTHIQLRILSSNWIVSFNITWWSISIPGGVLVTVSYSTTHAFTILIFHCLSFVINTFTISNDSCHWVAYLHIRSDELVHWFCLLLNLNVNCSGESPNILATIWCFNILQSFSYQVYKSAW